MRRTAGLRRLPRLMHLPRNTGHTCRRRSWISCRSLRPARKSYIDPWTVAAAIEASTFMTEVLDFVMDLGARVSSELELGLDAATLRRRIACRVLSDDRGDVNETAGTCMTC